MKRALITGITGQDGSYLAELLISKGYDVHGVIRRSSSFNTGRLENIYQDPHIDNNRLHLHYGDLADSSMLSSLIYTIIPDEIYNLGGQSHVRVSFDMPEYTADINALACTRILEAIKATGTPCRYYQASSSELYGNAPAPQNETTPFQPCSPYATSKLYSYWTTRNYRETYGIYAVNGILFNHESPRRGPTFVTKKIIDATVKIILGKQDILYLGNLEAKRDWGYAPEYVQAMWLMLQQDAPDDYVIATGETHTVNEFLNLVFSIVGLDPARHVMIDAQYFRPTEVNELRGDASKAEKELGWKPKTKFAELVNLMVEHEFKMNGINIYNRSKYNVKSDGSK